MYQNFLVRVKLLKGNHFSQVSFTPPLNQVYVRIGFGGKGANQAIQAARLANCTESIVSFIGKVGQDSFGTDTIQNFKSHNIDHTFLMVADDPNISSGLAPITVDERGENSIVVIGGANDLLTTDEVEKSRSAIDSAKYLIVQLEIPLEISLAAMRIAYQSGTKIILNTAPAQPLSSEIISLCHIIIPNRVELSMLSGLPTETIEDVKVAAQVLINQGAKAIVCTLGSAGSMLVTSEQSIHCPIPESLAGITVVDTTGAGDCFVGSLAFFLAHDISFIEAIHRASYVAGTSVTKKGTQTSYPHASELPSHIFEGVM